MRGLFTVVAAVLSSGLLATLVAFFFSSQLAERNTRRRKLEELYSIVHGQLERLQRQVRYLDDIQKDPSKINDAYQKMRADNAWRTNANERVAILVAIYFPHLLPVREEMTLMGERVKDLFSGLRTAGNDLMGVIDEQRKFFDVMAASYTAFLFEVYITAKRVNRPLWKFWR